MKHPLASLWNDFFLAILMHFLLSNFCRLFQKMTSLGGPSQVLQLYKTLLRYGQQLKLTDQTYFCNIIRKEFRSQKDAKSQTQIEFLIKVP